MLDAYELITQIHSLFKVLPEDHPLIDPVFLNFELYIKQNSDEIKRTLINTASSKLIEPLKKLNAFVLQSPDSIYSTELTHKIIMETLIFRLTHPDLESSSALISNVLSFGLKSNKNQTITAEVLGKIEFSKENPTETLNNISLILDLLSIK